MGQASSRRDEQSASAYFTGAIAVRSALANHGMIAELAAQRHHLYAYASHVCLRRLEAVFRRRLFQAPAQRLPSGNLCSVKQRAALVCKSHLCAVLVTRCMYLQGVPAIRHPLQLAVCVVSRCHCAKTRRRLSCPTAPICVWWRKNNWSVAFDPSGCFLATCSGDQTINVWALNKDRLLAVTGREWAKNGNRHFLAFHPSGRYLVAGPDCDGSSVMWAVNEDCNAGWPIWQLDECRMFDPCFAFHPSGRFLASGKDSFIKLWVLKADCSWGYCGLTLEGHGANGPVTSLAFHPSGRYMASGSHDLTARMWALNSECSAGTCALTLKGHARQVSSLAFHPSGRYLATGSFDRSVKLWALNEDCSAETCVLTLKGGDFFRSVAFHPSGHLLATASDDNGAEIWELSEDFSRGRRVASANADCQRVNFVAFLPSGAHLVTCCAGGPVRLWR